MTVWTVLAGALAAALVAWISIAGFAWLGQRDLHTGPIRLFGAAALACLALAVAGLPVPWMLAPVLLGIGLVAGVAPGIVDRVTA